VFPDPVQMDLIVEQVLVRTVVDGDRYGSVKDLIKRGKGIVEIETDSLIPEQAHIPFQDHGGLGIGPGGAASITFFRKLIGVSAFFLFNSDNRKQVVIDGVVIRVEIPEILKINNFVIGFLLGNDR
jgi:hypothetical protein